MRRAAKLGQHFLKARWAARAVARACPLTEDNTVLEIGPGRGALTRELLYSGANVIAIEKDGELVEHLEEVFAQEIAVGRLRIMHEDIRDIAPASLGLEPQRYGVAANIPYYITGEIVRSLLSSVTQPRCISLLVQKEVAERIARSKKESILSLSVKAYGTPRYMKTVGKECFSPKPRVDSAILVIEDISRDFFDTIDEETFFKIVRAGFASKRKLLVNNLAVRFGKSQSHNVFKKCDVPEKARAEDVNLDRWKCITAQLN